MEHPLGELDGLVRAATRRVVGETISLDAVLQQTYTFDGEGAIKIVVLFPSPIFAELSGNELLDITREIWNALSSVGESRFPFIGVARIEDKPELSGARTRPAARPSGAASRATSRS